jgi:uncharacterized protein YcbX
MRRKLSWLAVHVAALWRYPVKSMGGEQVDQVDVGPNGIAGDRAFALVDRADGHMVSAKNPRKWGELLQCQAAYLDGPDRPATITMPDGSQMRTDDPDIDERLTRFVGREVGLSAAAADSATYEAEWPDIDGVIPADFLAKTHVEGGNARLTALRPQRGTFFDLAAMHLLAAATLEHLGELAPASRFDVRRYRPNVVIGGAEGGFVENGWMTGALRLGATVELRPVVPTMRCIMTTLAQGDLARDAGTLRAVAAHNRIEIPGFGTWSCAGLYADVAAPGRVVLNDPFEVV